jgi:hypothetical protein
MVSSFGVVERVSNLLYIFGLVAEFARIQVARNWWNFATIAVCGLNSEETGIYYERLTGANRENREEFQISVFSVISC